MEKPCLVFDGDMDSGAQTDNPFLQGIPGNAFFYFVHSYYVQPEDPADTAALRK